MRLQEKKLLAVITNALRTIPFPREGLKGIPGLAMYTADMRVAMPLILEVIDSLLRDETGDAENAVKALTTWLEKRIAADWEPW